MKSVHLRRIDITETIGQKLGLFLIVPFQGHTVSGTDNCLQEGNGAGGLYNLAFAPFRQCLRLGHPRLVFLLAAFPVFSRMYNLCSHKFTSGDVKKMVPHSRCAGHHSH